MISSVIRNLVQVTTSDFYSNCIKIQGCTFQLDITVMLQSHTEEELRSVHLLTEYIAKHTQFEEQANLSEQEHEKNG